MKELDENMPIQRTQMESAMLLAEAVEKATKLGFTLVASGLTVDVLPWQGQPLIRDMVSTGSALFESGYLTNLIDWLDGVAHGRTNINN